MRQTTLPEQTAKLIGLGFEKPRVAMPKFEWKDGEPQFHYTIGELFEMLKPIKNLRISVDNSYNGFEDLIIKRLVGDKWEILFGAVSKDLIDLLFSAIVKLKEEENL